MIIIVYGIILGILFTHHPNSLWDSEGHTRRQRKSGTFGKSRCPRSR